MTINRHALGINIRTIGIGIIAVVLILALLNPFGGIQMLIQSRLLLLIAAVMVISGQIIASKYKQDINNSPLKTSREKVYSLIGISLILVVFSVILLMAFISSIG